MVLTDVVIKIKLFMYTFSQNACHQSTTHVFFILKIKRVLVSIMKLYVLLKRTGLH